MLSFNILPPEEKKFVSILKRTKIAWVWGLTSLVCIACLALLLLPSYFMLAFEKEEILRTLAFTKESPIARRIATAKKSIEFLKISASEFEKISKSTNHFSDILTDIVYALPGGITVSAMTLSAQTNELAIQGFADTRKSLVLLESSLKAIERVKNIEIPLASLVRDERIPFSVTVTLIKDDKFPPTPGVEPFMQNSQ